MPRVAVIMGSRNDYEHLKDAVDTLKSFGVEAEARVVSAHRTPKFMMDYAENAEKNGIEVIIAAAGGAAHLPGMVASCTAIPVIGVPVPSKNLNGIDSLLSIVQMPKGIPVATVAIGNSLNAALLAIRILSVKYSDLRDKMKAYMERQTSEVLKDRIP